MIDHTGIIVRDYSLSRDFYLSTLGAIGYELMNEIPASVTGHTDVAGFGEAGKPDFWISKGSPNKPPTHIAFRVTSRALVDAFYHAAIKAGGQDNGPPGLGPLCSIPMAIILKRSATRLWAHRRNTFIRPKPKDLTDQADPAFSLTPLCNMCRACSSAAHLTSVRPSSPKRRSRGCVG